MSFAKSYARALFETVQSIQPGALNQVATELDHFTNLLVQSEDLRNVLAAPTISSGEKTQILEALFKKTGYSPFAQNFLMLLTKKARTGGLTQIGDAFRTLLVEAQGGIVGSVISADPLESSDLDSLSSAFEKKLGKKVIFRGAVDSQLLAGMKVTVQGVTYDGSLRSQLKRLRERLVYGSRSI